MNAYEEADGDRQRRREMEGGKCKISKNSPMERAPVTNVSFRFAHFQLVFVLLLASFCKTCETRHMFNRMRNKYCEWTHFNVRRTYCITRRDRAMGCGRRHCGKHFILFDPRVIHVLSLAGIWIGYCVLRHFLFICIRPFVRSLPFFSWTAITVRSWTTTNTQAEEQPQWALRSCLPSNVVTFYGIYEVNFGGYKVSREKLEFCHIGIGALNATTVHRAREYQRWELTFADKMCMNLFVGSG